MKQITKCSTVLLAILLFAASASIAQNSNKDNSTTKQNQMKTYVIERDIPGAGKLTGAELKSISQTSCTVLKEMGPKIEWIHSYVTGNKIYCIYKAESAELVREHAKKGGFPANSVNEVANIINPSTAE